MNRSLLLIITLVVANFGALYLLGDRVSIHQDGVDGISSAGMG